MDSMEKDTLFLALTRPPMLMGVPFEGFLVNFVASFFVGLWLGNPFYWLIGVLIHFPMRVIASADHNFFRVWRLWTVTSSGGDELWGGSMLSPMTSRSSTSSKERSSCV